MCAKTTMCMLTHTRITFMLCEHMNSAHIYQCHQVKALIKELGAEKRSRENLAQLIGSHLRVVLRNNIDGNNINSINADINSINHNINNGNSDDNNDDSNYDNHDMINSSTSDNNNNYLCVHKTQ
eukprot:GHVS01025472.1.p2 GENE.GHVS01025472.1~~GHVS01025472.1.p2  ORF type:complete len:125 (+),score=30.63 GHVS01025472.1:104-478(+)